MGIVSRVGHWLDQRFPEKVSADLVSGYIKTTMAKMEKLEVSLDNLRNQVNELTHNAQLQDVEIAILKDEMNKAKTFIGIKQRLSSTHPGANGK